MGASFQKVEAYFVFHSDGHRQEVFANLEADLREVAEMIPFVSLNGTYLFVNDSAHMPYSTAGMLEAYFSVLSDAALWGQYFIESEELEINSSYTKPLEHGLYAIAPVAVLNNIPDFGSYFITPPGWRKITWEGPAFFVSVFDVTTPAGTGFCIGQSPDTNKLPHILTASVFLVEHNSVYCITSSGAIGRPETTLTFSDNAYLKEVFATSDKTQHGNAFQLSEESGFYQNHFRDVEQSVTLNGVVYTDCIVLEHDYIHVNCYHHAENPEHDFERYRCSDNIWYSYWQKNAGLVGFAFPQGDARGAYNFECISNEAYWTEKEQPDQGKPPRKGFFGRLFSKD